MSGINPAMSYILLFYVKIVVFYVGIHFLLFSDNTRNCDWKNQKFQKLWRINFIHSQFLKYLWWNHFPSQIFQKLWVEKLILHTFWKIPLFPVILSWIIYDNELKTVKYISLTKSIRRENVRQTMCIFVLNLLQLLMK